MDKLLEIVSLLDCYGELLTEKQRNVMELYYSEDLSLSEIAEHEKITRQGVHDSIKRSEQYLFEMEQKLGFVARNEKLTRKLGRIGELAAAASAENAKYSYSRNIDEYMHELIGCIEELDEII